MELVTKIKEFREKEGLTQADLAEKVGARRETIVHLENGKYNRLFWHRCGSVTPTFPYAA